MAERSRIEWTDQTWNVVTGCTKVSAGCDRCYADTFLRRWEAVPGHHFATGFAPTIHPGRLAEPLRWRTPRLVFVAALGDLFHEAVPDEHIAQVWAVMLLAEQHIFQVLTKRPARMRSLLSSLGFAEQVITQAFRLASSSLFRNGEQPWWSYRSELPQAAPIVLPNVGVGVSAETQRWADIRIPILRETPASWRWVSCEPLLSPIQLSSFLAPPAGFGAGLDWVVVGGESGPGARPLDLAAAADLVGQCRSYEVPVFVKQLGSVWARAHGQRGRGADPTSWPPALRVRQLPTIAATAALSTKEDS